MWVMIIPLSKKYFLVLCLSVCVCMCMRERERWVVAGVLGDQVQNRVTLGESRVLWGGLVCGESFSCGSWADSEDNGTQ